MREDDFGKAVAIAVLAVMIVASVAFLVLMDLR